MKNKVLVALIAFCSVAGGLHAVSIQELVDQKKIPKIKRLGWNKLLDLSNLNIDSLEGLENIKGIETVQILRLKNNKLTTIRAGAFTKAIKLRGLGLASNDISTIEPNAFAGLKDLWALVLNSNDIDSIPEEGLSGMPSLKFLSLGDNPILARKRYKAELKNQVPQAIVFTWPITWKNLSRGGIVIASALAVIVTAVVGIKMHEKPVEGKTPAESPELGTEKPIEEKDPIDLALEEEEKRLMAEEGKIGQVPQLPEGLVPTTAVEGPVEVTPAVGEGLAALTEGDLINALNEKMKALTEDQENSLKAVTGEWKMFGASYVDTARFLHKIENANGAYKGLREYCQDNICAASTDDILKEKRELIKAALTDFNKAKDRGFLLWSLRTGTAPTSGDDIERFETALSTLGFGDLLKSYDETMTEDENRTELTKLWAGQESGTAKKVTRKLEDAKTFARKKAG